MPFGFGYIGHVVSASVLRQAARFHGHLGPWLVLGMQAGAYARRKLAASPFELSARVFCPADTPYTCFVDGVQFSSGCTMGKGNISHHRAKGCRVEFTRTGDGNGVSRKDTVPRTDEVRCQKLDVRSQKSRPDRIRLTLRPEVWDELHRRSGSGMADAAKLGREFARRRLSDLFTARPTTAAPGASN
jgi:formylmethanofuran dehydrogenase subunit E